MNTATFTDTKRHYPILDGLRGVAALMVVAFHLCEAHAPSRFAQVINHGYLAVDFFFLLSGFVIGYAYDDRWGSMTTGDFFRRRLVRLHPMIVAGTLVGALMFYAGAGAFFPNIAATPVWLVVVVMVIGMTLIPVGQSLDIRGWAEMHPLDGPAWSLFYEYVANVLYALVVRHFSRTLLALCVGAFAALLLHYLVTGPQGDVIGGWSLDATQIRIALTRLLYPFFAGLLLSRTVRVGSVRHAFPLCSAIVIAALALPRFGGETQLWLNGLYEAFVIVAVFPLVVWLGASGHTHGAASARACDFLGALSYPLYITHYPFVYAYTAWVAKNKLPLADGLPYVAATFAGCVALATLLLYSYDIPVRRWLGARLVRARAQGATVTP